MLQVNDHRRTVTFVLMLRKAVSWLGAMLAVLVVIAAPAHGAGERAYVADGSGAVSVVDVGSGTVLRTIPVGARPLDVAVSPDGSRAYVTNSLSHTISVIDTATDTVIATVPGCYNALTIAVSPDGSRVYAVCSSGPSLFVIDAATNTVVLGRDEGYLGFVLAVAVSPDGSRLYLAESLYNHYGPMVGNLVVADAATGDVLARVPVYDPSSITLSPDGTRAYVLNQRGGFSVVDLTTQTVVATVDEGHSFFGGLALSPGGDRIYFTNTAAGTLLVLDAATYAVLAEIPVGSELTHVAVSPDGTRVLVSDAASGTVAIVDTATNTVVSTAAVGGRPSAIAFVPALAAPAAKEQCKHGGWRAYPQFRNEGDCVSSTVARR